MVDLQRALLDELMGTARDLTEEQKKVHREPRWDDAAACACFLARFCPHDLFFNTKSDLGACTKLHDAKLKESFEQSSRHDQYLPRFEAELARTCEKLVSDLDRKVRRGRERLAQDVDLVSLLPLSAEAKEHLAGLEAKVAKLLEQSEVLGEQGRIDEAQALMKKVEALNDEKTVALDAASSERGLIMSQEKKMALCEICGSFLVASETMDRTASHASGKQHIGYGMIRDFLKEYKEKRLEVKEAERVAKEKTMAAPSKSQDFKTSDREAVESERGNAAEAHGRDVASATRGERESCGELRQWRLDGDAHQNSSNNFSNGGFQPDIRRRTLHRVGEKRKEQYDERSRWKHGDKHCKADKSRQLQSDHTTNS